jgi:hypothetical protein
MKMYGGMEIKLRNFTLALGGGEWSASGLGRVTSGTLQIGSWVGAMEKRKILPL